MRWTDWLRMAAAGGFGAWLFVLLCIIYDKEASDWGKALGAIWIAISMIAFVVGVFGLIFTVGH